MKLTDRIIDCHTYKTQFKIYTLHDSDQLIIPRYVGVTVRDPIERLNQHIHHAIGTPVINWIRNRDYDITMKIWRYVETKEEMYQLERSLVSSFPNLLNTSKHNK